MNSEEAIFYNNILANIPTDHNIFSSDLETLGVDYRIKAAIIKMADDGFVKIHSRIDDYALLISITPHGIVFRDDGGYVKKYNEDEKASRKQEKSEARKVQNDTIRTYATILSVLIAAISLWKTLQADKKIDENRDFIQTERARIDSIETQWPLSKNIDTVFMRKFFDLMSQDSAQKESPLKQ